MKKNSASLVAATEKQNPRSRNLDLKSAREILRIINSEDASVARAVSREIPKIARAVEQISSRLRKGGRLFYLGAGSSGRLGILDASEIPPTFGVPGNIVRGIIAGGHRAITHAVEGAEDDLSAAARDLRRCNLSVEDVVVGIAASGSTPYVLGAVKFARSKGAYTIGITTNARTPLSRIAHLTIEPLTGPEVVAGSTRMKAGTAQKMVLNMLSTATMIRLGLIYDNWMINVHKSNLKLKRRALRNLRDASGANASEAERALREASGDLRIALVMLKTGLDTRQARLRLAVAGGNARLAIHSAAQSPNHRPLRN